MWVLARLGVETAKQLKAGQLTATTKEVQAAVRAVLPGELAKHAVSEGAKAAVKCVSLVSSV